VFARFKRAYVDGLVKEEERNQKSGCYEFYGRKEQSGNDMKVKMPEFWAKYRQ
jgi:hypothetical protein